MLEEDPGSCYQISEQNREKTRKIAQISRFVAGKEVGITKRRPRILFLPRSEAASQWLQGFPRPEHTLARGSNLTIPFKKGGWENRGAQAAREFIEELQYVEAVAQAFEVVVNVFHLMQREFFPRVRAVSSVGQFYELPGGGKIIFT
jgi:hypothetical protein